MPRRFLDEKYQDILERVKEITPELADTLLDRHTDSPWEGGCLSCYWDQPCMVAAFLALRVRS